MKSINLKTTYFIVLLCLIVMCSCSQNKARIELKQAIAEANKDCPRMLVDGTKLVSMTVNDEDGQVVFTYIASPMYNIPKIANKKDMLRNIQLQMLVSTEETAELMSLLITADYGLKILFMSDNSGESLELVSTCEQIKDAKNYPLGRKEILQQNVEITKCMLPLVVDDITVLSDVILEGQNLVYVYEISGDGISLNALEQNKGQLKEVLKEQLKGLLDQDITTKNVIMCNMGICYSYKIKNINQSVDILITNDELREMTQNYIVE